MTPERTRRSIALDGGVWRELKTRAARNGTTIADEIERAVRNEVYTGRIVTDDIKPPRTTPDVAKVSPRIQRQTQRLIGDDDWGGRPVTAAPKKK